MTTTTIRNEFTDYDKTIRTQGMPAVSTIQRHLRQSKARDCASVTKIWIDGIRHDLIDHGRGLELSAY